MKPNKTLALCAFILASCSIAEAQLTPESFLSRLPPIPNVVCNDDTTAINRFSNRIFEVKAGIRQAVDRIHAEYQAKAENRKYSGEAQVRNSADKMIKEQHNLSMDELEKVGEMSDAEQEKWVQNYANSMMTQSSQNKSTKNTDKSARLLELTKEQNALGERITNAVTRAAQSLESVEQVDIDERRLLNEKIEPLEKQLCSGICSPAEIARSNAAEKQIHNLRVKFCEKMSPLQVNAIAQYLTIIKSLFPDYRRLAQLQNEMVITIQQGELTPIDLSCFTAIDEYATVLLGAYNYWIGKFEQ